MTEAAAAPPTTGIDRAHRRVIFAASLGTVFEWFDFYLYGTLAVFFGALFFPPGNETAAFLASLATFGAGFAVRPLGALVFGRIGDLIGRKYTFLITIVVMGLSTALVGVLPTFAQIGIWAPVLLVLLRLAQGLALGGEYGGAATYVAEHAPQGRRGYYTSWIQTTATLGFFLSLAVILGCRIGFGEETFKAWGWRVPFLVSVILLGISVYIRLKLEVATSYLLIAAALLIGTPFFIFFGKLSDRIGRKPIIVAGCVLSVLTFVPLFKSLTHFANPALAEFERNAAITVAARDCHFNIFASRRVSTTS
jgi:MFS family permease